MRLENNQLIQGLVELKWMTKEAVPLLSTRMYEDETSVVGKLRAHGLTAEAIFEAAIYANDKLSIKMPVVDLTTIPPMAEFDLSTFATKEEMQADSIVPVMMLDNRLVVATADPFNEKSFDTIALRSPFKIDYWIANSDEIKKKIELLNQAPVMDRFIAKPAQVEESSPVKQQVEETVVTEKIAEPQKTISPNEPENDIGGYTAGRKEPTLSYMNHIEQSPQSALSTPKEPVVTPHTMDSVAPIIATPNMDVKLQEESNQADAVSEHSMDHSDEENSADHEIEMDTDSDIEVITSADDIRFVELQDSSLDTDELETRVEADDDAQAFYEAEDHTIIVEEYPEEQQNELSATLETGANDHSNKIILVSEQNDINDALDSDEIAVVQKVIEGCESSDSDLEKTLEHQSDNESVNIVLEEQQRIEDLDSESASIVQAAESADVDYRESADIVEYINFVLLDAITQKASDIHFEPYESSYRIRFRIDGILHKVYVLPEQYRSTISSRLKVMAELDIAERRLPQDGHITICLEEETVDARISVIPTLWGEKIVIRLLDKGEMNLSLAKLGLTQGQKGIVQAAIEKSQGLILVTGPTGSGKTVSLYACLNHLNLPSRNIATVEDPIEINLEGINQLQIHPKIGLDFAEALRSFLRQDPDVLMLGEIRDYETADITMKAAQTGHLVLSTLHTNSAVDSLVRLKNMGVELYNIASTVKLVIAQRLLRELCHCKEEDIVDSDYLESLGFTPMQAASRFYRASSCSECHDGYRGRFAIFEVMPISKRVESLILEDASSSDIRAQAEREGVKSLRQAGIEAVIDGRTSLEEILRVTAE